MNNHFSSNPRFNRVIGRVSPFLLLLGTLLMVSSITGATSAAPGNDVPITPQPVPSDLGDAPDSSNHFNVPMTAYPLVVAGFPTVFDTSTGIPPGPRHNNQPLLYYLGARISYEREADIGPDADGINNIVPVADNPNNDHFDDAFSLLGQPPHCQVITMTYKVTVVGPGPYNARVNLWFDWTRNGRWGETPACSPSASAPEWVVPNQVINLPGPGTYLFNTPPFLTYNPDKTPIWFRITLSDSPAPASAKDGRGIEGPSNLGYLYGETEDYLIPGIKPPPDD